jgi:hypothetical protein
MHIMKIQHVAYVVQLWILGRLDIYVYTMSFVDAMEPSPGIDQVDECPPFRAAFRSIYSVALTPIAALRSDRDTIVAVHSARHLDPVYALYLAQLYPLIMGSAVAWAPQVNRS